jgi:hypothetical protein
MRYDTTARRIYVRQSWLGDILICPERARLGLLHPERREASDATIMGTAVHTGIEKFLNTPNPDFSDVVATSVRHWNELAAQPHAKSSGIPPEAAPSLIESMLLAFIETVAPQVEVGGATEHKFAVPMGMVYDGWDIWLEGTMDYVTPSGVIWDWKTAKRAYSAKDKQAHSVQASVYAYACGLLGLVGDPNRVDFRFGVVMRQQTPKAQVVQVIRTNEHNAWLRDQVRSAVIMAHRLDTAVPWLKNDQGNLCSAKWCNHWASCKGAFVTDDHSDDGGQ